VLTLVAGPTVEPISVEDAKAALNETGEDQDVFIETLIAAARQQVQRDAQRTLLTETWDLSCDRVPAGTEPLPLLMRPVQSVTSVTTYGLDDAASVMSASEYFLDGSDEPRICLAANRTWPSALRTYRACVVRFVAGSGDQPSDAPARLVLAMHLLIGHWFRNREAVGEVGESIALAYEALIDRPVYAGGL
jgi:uncharacterized phiE125 gp8 family phage protein